MKTSSLIKNAILFAIIAFLGYTFINKLLKLDSFALNIIKTNVFDGIWTYVAVAYALVSELACIVTLIFKERIGKILTLAVILSYIISLVQQSLRSMWLWGHFKRAGVSLAFRHQRRAHYNFTLSKCIWRKELVTSCLICW